MNCENRDKNDVICNSTIDVDYADFDFLPASMLDGITLICADCVEKYRKGTMREILDFSPQVDTEKVFECKCGEEYFGEGDICFECEQDEAEQAEGMVDAVQEAIALIEQANELVSNALSGTKHESHFMAYGNYGLSQALGNGNPRDASLHDLVRWINGEED